jgi:hypothetical protein
MKTSQFLWLGLFPLAFGLTGCGGDSSPSLIASSPRNNDAPDVISEDVRAVPWSDRVAVVMEVEGMENATIRIRETAEGYGGSITSVSSWQKNEMCYRKILISVPNASRHAILHALPRFGTILREDWGGSTDERSEPVDWNRKTILTIQLISTPAACQTTPRIEKAMACFAAWWESALETTLQTGLAICTCIAGMIPIALMLIGLASCIRWLCRL